MPRVICVNRFCGCNAIFYTAGSDPPPCPPQGTIYSEITSGSTPGFAGCAEHFVGTQDLDACQAYLTNRFNCQPCCGGGLLHGTCVLPSECSAAGGTPRHRLLGYPVNNGKPYCLDFDATFVNALTAGEICRSGGCCNRTAGNCTNVDLCVLDCQSTFDCFGRPCAELSPTECAQACCLPNGQCIMTGGPTCLAQGGRHVPTMHCNQNPCNIQACCRGFQCTDEPAESCVASGGGRPQGVNTSCATTVCVANGACCFPDGRCRSRSRADCIAQGGIPRSAGSLCQPNPCPQPPVDETAPCCLCGKCCDMKPVDCEARGGTVVGSVGDPLATCSNAGFSNSRQCLEANLGICRRVPGVTMPDDRNTSTRTGITTRPDDKGRTPRRFLFASKNKIRPEDSSVDSAECRKFRFNIERKGHDLFPLQAAARFGPTMCNNWDRKPRDYVGFPPPVVSIDMRDGGAKRTGTVNVRNFGEPVTGPNAKPPRARPIMYYRDACKELVCN